MEELHPRVASEKILIVYRNITDVYKNDWFGINGKFSVCISV